MKGLLLLLLALVLISGCSFIIAEDQDISTFGIKKEDASSLRQEIQRQRPENPQGVDLFPGTVLK